MLVSLMSRIVRCGHSKSLGQSSDVLWGYILVAQSVSGVPNGNVVTCVGTSVAMTLIRS